MFMRENRRKNGAAQPEQTAASDASAQRAAKKLSPNEYPSSGAGADWRFPAKLSTCAAINEAHYQGGLSGHGVYDDAYASSIPFVGTEPPSSPDRELKSR